MSKNEVGTGTISVETTDALGNVYKESRQQELVTIENAVGKISYKLGLTLQMRTQYEMARIDVGIEIPIASNSPQEIESTFARAKAWVEKNVTKEAEQVKQ